MLTHVSGSLAGIGHKQGSQSGPFSVQVKMTDLCLIQGREKFVSYWKRQKSPGCFHFVILLQESGLCQYKSMSPAHSCHSELTLFMADMKTFHFQILSNAHLWTEAACGRKPVILLNHREKRKNCLNAIQQSVVWFLPPGGQIKDAWCVWGSTSGMLWHRDICFVNHEPAILVYESLLLQTLVNCTGIGFTTQPHICEIV